MIAIDSVEYAKMSLALGLGLILRLGAAIIHSSDLRLMLSVGGVAVLVVILLIGTVEGSDEPFERGWSDIDPQKFFGIDKAMRNLGGAAAPPPAAPQCGLPR